MSSLFYVYNGPPSGFTDFEELCKCLKARLTGKTSHVEDAVSHYLLCLLTLKYHHLRPIILSLEKDVFIKVITSLDCSSLKNSLNHFCDIVKTDIFLKPGIPNRLKQRLILVNRVVDTINARSEHVFNDKHGDTCRRIKLIVPFTFPLGLVKQRMVELKNGKAVIPCGLWRLLLVDVFVYVMELELWEMSKVPQVIEHIWNMEDDRLRHILEACARKLGGYILPLASQLSVIDLDHETKYFPPCMANLHQTLRKTHRLSYESRYQYTLFLKDTGLPFDENLSLWQSEYSKPHCEGSSCNHHWDEKKTRYQYQIKYIYGLVSDCVPKRSRDCTAFIGQIRNRMDAGCPFKHLSPVELRNALPKPLVKHAGDILHWKEQDEPGRCCAMYLSLQRPTPGLTQIFSPIQYYNLARSEN